MVPPALCIYASVASPYVRICFCFCYLHLCLLLGRFCRPYPASWTQKRWFSFLFGLVWFLTLCPCPLSCLPSGLVSSFCWYITWTYHKTDRASKQQPCPLGARPAPWLHAWCFWFVFFFSFFIFFSFPILFFLFCPFFALFLPFV